MNIIEIKNLSKEFRVGFIMKKIAALTDLNLSVEEGEIFGFIGPNGAGKTTTVKILTGLIYPTSGKAWIFGRDIRDVNIKRDIGFLPENPYFYDYLTAREFLNFYARLFSINKREIIARIDTLLDMVDLLKYKNVQLRRFSKGMLQRIGIAQALINDPKLVILDEPMSGLDPIGRTMIRDIILRMKDQGKTVFFSSHILSDVEMICDRVGMLFNGRLKDIGKLDTLLSTRVKSIEISASLMDDIYMESIKRLAANCILMDEKLFVVVNNETQKDEVLKIIEKGNGQLISLIPRRETLEDLFLKEINYR